MIIGAIKDGRFGNEDSDSDPDDTTTSDTGDAVNTGSDDNNASSNSNSSSNNSSSTSGTGSAGTGSNSGSGVPSIPCTISFSYLPCSFGGGADGHASQSAGNGSTAMCGGSPMVMNTSGDCSDVIFQQGNIVNSNGLSSKMMGGDCSIGNGGVGMDNKPYGGVYFSSAQLLFLNKNCADSKAIEYFTENYNGLGMRNIALGMIDMLMANQNTEIDLEVLKKMSTALMNANMVSNEAIDLLNLIKEGNYSEEIFLFSLDAIEANTNGLEVNFEEGYVNWNQNEDDTAVVYFGTKKKIPSELTLGNGDKVHVTFGKSNDGVTADQKVIEEVIDELKNALEEANNTFVGTSTPKIDEIYIKCTTNGVHSTSSNHPDGTTLDISRINGIKMINATGSYKEQIKQLQIAFDNVAVVRENFGPHFKHKYFKETGIWNYNYNVKDHKDHIHFSIRL